MGVSCYFLSKFVFVYTVLLFEEVEIILIFIRVLGVGGLCYLKLLNSVISY